ncbi:MAG: universal stress protein [Leptolyngbyaceae cyanobacterium SL_1_1]|nr:universal stress protein [Leptolyngbyaceae cyanobacterium SL_1_1]
MVSPWITERWGAQVQPVAPKTTNKDQASLEWGQRILVPVANPSTEDNLLNLAILLSKRLDGTLLPLHVLSDRYGAISAAEQLKQQQLLATAENLAHSAVVKVETIGRVDDSIDRGVIRTAAERQASLIVCGWKGYSTYRDSLFGDVIDNIVNQATTPVLIARFPQPIENVQRILLAVPAIRTLPTANVLAIVVAQQLAEELKAPLAVLLVWRGPKSRQAELSWRDRLPESAQVEEVQGNFVRRVSEGFAADDLLILPARRQQRQGKWVMQREPEAIAHKHWESSMIVVYTPVAGALYEHKPDQAESATSMPSSLSEQKPLPL